ncbi:MAG: PilZ domain-containing protein [Deltaproteobacteria bacterium]|nr:PilZ domain-containing protein [Deltaproteobacteria bacterium]
MSKTGIERRVHPRLALSLPVRISTIDSETDLATRRPFFRATREWCTNLSRGGVFVHTSERLAPGRRVLVEITLPDGRGFDSVGRVAWVGRGSAPASRSESAARDGIGIEFLAAAPADRCALERTLRTAREGTGSASRYVV